MAVSIGMICFLRDMTFGRNMCLSFGVRIEDVMILHENGAEVITKAPKQLTIL